MYCYYDTCSAFKCHNQGSDYRIGMLKNEELWQYMDSKKLQHVFYNAQLLLLALIIESMVLLFCAKFEFYWKKIMIIT